MNLSEENLKTVLFCLDEMQAMVEKFEGKKLPDFAVGAIIGWRKRALRALGIVASFPIETFSKWVEEEGGIDALVEKFKPKAN